MSSYQDSIIYKHLNKIACEWHCVHNICMPNLHFNKNFIILIFDSDFLHVFMMNDTPVHEENHRVHK